MAYFDDNYFDRTYFETDYVAPTVVGAPPKKVTPKPKQYKITIPIRFNLAQQLIKNIKAKSWIYNGLNLDVKVKASLWNELNLQQHVFSYFAHPLNKSTSVKSTVANALTLREKVVGTVFPYKYMEPTVTPKDVLTELIRVRKILDLIERIEDEEDE